jgi:hypothetical protein
LDALKDRARAGISVQNARGKLSIGERRPLTTQSARPSTVLPPLAAGATTTLASSPNSSSDAARGATSPAAAARAFATRCCCRSLYVPATEITARLTTTIASAT